MQVKDLKEEACEGMVTRIDSSTPKLYQLMRHLREVPDTKLNSLITQLFPKESAVGIIEDISHSGESKENNLKNIGKEFLKEKDPSWTKVYRALKEAGCDDQAEIVKVCCLPI